MSVLYIVIPLAIVLAGVALAAFFWAVHRGQFDDLDTPAMRPLFEDADELDRRGAVRRGRLNGVGAGSPAPPSADRRS